MSFTTALQAAAALGSEYIQTKGRVGGMACAEDHDPTWDAGDEARLNAEYARIGELAQRLAATFIELERDHDKAWHEFLVASTERLGALSRNGEAGRIAAEYEHDQWLRWTRGELPGAEQPEIFARGVDVLSKQ